MAWTSPKTWTATTLSVSDMQAQVSDNLSETAPAKVTTAGDVVVGTGANAIKRLAMGTASQVLAVNSGATDLEWADSLPYYETAASGNYFMIPAGPSRGTSVASSTSADTYGSWVEVEASTAAAIWIVGVNLEASGAPAYVQIEIGTGATPTSVGEVKASGTTNTNGTSNYVPLLFPIPVPTTTSIDIRTADNEAIANGHWLSLFCINQSDVAVI